MPKSRLIAVVVIVLGVLGFAAISIFGLKNDPRELPSALIGKRIPEFALENLLEADGTITEQDLLGKPALINVWATWCPTCRQEHEDLNQLARRDVLIYGINYRDDKTKAQQWLSDLLNPYALSISDPKGKLGFELGVYGAPETFVIDHLGVVHMRHVGEVNQQVWKEKIGPLYKRLLAEAAQEQSQ